MKHTQIIIPLKLGSLTQFGKVLLQLSDTLKETKTLGNKTTVECRNVQQMWFSAQFELAKFMIEIKSLTNGRNRW